jgi:hypothetical protein
MLWTRARQRAIQYINILSFATTPYTQVHQHTIKHINILSFSIMLRWTPTYQNTVNSTSTHCCPRHHFEIQHINTHSSTSTHSHPRHSFEIQHINTPHSASTYFHPPQRFEIRYANIPYIAHQHTFNLCTISPLSNRYISPWYIKKKVCVEFWHIKRAVKHITTCFNSPQVPFT